MKPRKPEYVIPLDGRAVSRNILDNMDVMIQDYFKLLGKPIKEKIFFQRYKEGKTLKSIGAGFNITRERTRQIKEEVLNALRRLVYGFSLNKPPVICREDLISDIREFSLIGRLYTEKDMPETEERYKIYILSDLCRLKRGEYMGAEFFCNSDPSEYIEACTKVDDYLKDICLSATMDEIQENTGLKKIIIRECFKIIPHIEKSDDGYQIRLDALRTRGDKVYRILYREKKPLPYKYFKEYLGGKMFSGFLSQDPRLVAVGKTGYWALKEWGTDTRTLETVIHDLVEEKGGPVSVSDIKDYIAHKRPEYSEVSVYSTIRMNQDIFLILKEERVILAEWEPAYKDQLMIGKRYRGRSHAKFFEVFISYLISHPCSSSKDIVKHICEKTRAKVCTVKAFFYSKGRMLCDADITGTEYYLKKDYIYILSKIYKKEKREAIVEEIKEYLRESGKKTTPLIDVVSYLEEIHGFKYPTIYRAVSKSHELIVGEDPHDNRKKTIALKG